MHGSLPAPLGKEVAVLGVLELEGLHEEIRACVVEISKREESGEGCER